MIRFKPKGLRLSLLALAAVILAGCAGEDFTPVYFPPPEEEAAKGPSPSEGAGGRQCTLSFTSQLCIAIKGDNIEVGTNPDDLLCAEVPAFPIHVEGLKVSIKGDEFPDIGAEGHGLPAPITINGRGTSDGASNIGEGTIDASGNMTIEHFSLYIVALGIVGEVPNLTLTTGSTDELPNLPAAQGSPPDAGGAMTLVAGTVLGHTIDAADKYLMGASLAATFAGSVSPPLSQCGGEGEKTIEVKKLFVSKDGTQTESPIPDGKRMEVSSGTYIAEGPSDVGDRYEAAAKFRVRNIGTKPQSIQVPPRIGPFYLKSIDSLTRTLAPQQSFVLDVTFKPTSADKPGEIAMPLPVGIDQLLLVGVALSKSGKGSVSVVDDEGNLTLPDVGGVDVGQAQVPANAERAFFLCKEVACGGARSWTACGECKDPATTPCELLPVSTSGRPMGEVDGNCKPVEPDAAPFYTIDLKGSSEAAIAGHKQVLAIRNKGVAAIKITGISLKEIGGSRSTGQFSIPKGAIFVAKNFAEIQKNVAAALAGNNPQGANLPIALPPFEPGWDETTLYVAVTYEPSDLLGADGQQAGVGSEVRDKALVRITTDSGDITATVTGTTTIREAPALELYFKTSTGTKQTADGGSFSLRGVTAETIDLAYPLFLRVADTAPGALRIASITIDGTDAANFRWLDTAEEIAAVKPPSGKGLRCSISIVDESTGEMTGESFDLKPASLDPPGFDIAPGAYSTDTMPFFGCVDFHRDEGAPAKRLFEARLVVTAQELSAAGTPLKNPDGSYRQTTLSARLLAAINPKSGKMVVRITQTMAAILNPQFPGLSAIASREDVEDDLKSGRMKESDLQLFTVAFVLDPFDETTITTSDGKEVLSTPNDGVTAVFRAIDTHPVSQNYEDEWLFDYANLLFDSSRPEGGKGVYEDFPNVPDGARANGWRVFTSSLSYPGPLGPPEKMPKAPSGCIVVNPCDPGDLKKFTDAGVPPGGKGACAFFYTTGGRYDSPAFHRPEEMEGGEYDKLCNIVDRPQKLVDINTGRYSVDGRIVFEEVGLRFSGPTFFHNPGGPLGPKPLMDEIFYMGFTTGVLKPPKGPNDLNVLPDQKIDFARGEFKINLNDKTLGTVPICDNNTMNRVVNGKRYSTWRYLDGLIFKDEDATTPAGCPEEGNKFTGGSAYLRGRDMDPETGVVTFVAAGKYGSSDDLSFAFKDVMLFAILNGWMCDPMGSEDNFEGSRCYDLKFNDRDAAGQISIMK